MRRDPRDRDDYKDFSRERRDDRRDFREFYERDMREELNQRRDKEKLMIHDYPDDRDMRRDRGDRGFYDYNHGNPLFHMDYLRMNPAASKYTERFVAPQFPRGNVPPRFSHAPISMPQRGNFPVLNLNEQAQQPFIPQASTSGPLFNPQLMSFPQGSSELDWLRQERERRERDERKDRDDRRDRDDRDRRDDKRGRDKDRNDMNKVKDLREYLDKKQG